MAKRDGIEIQMKELLDDINLEVKKSAEKSISAVAREAVRKLKNTSPKKTGAYAKGWGTKRKSPIDVVVYNKTHYYLTHLLENGHIIRNKRGTYGRTRPIKHIEPVAEWAKDELPRRIMRNIP